MTRFSSTCYVMRTTVLRTQHVTEFFFVLVFCFGVCSIKERVRAAHVDRRSKVPALFGVSNQVTSPFACRIRSVSLSFDTGGSSCKSRSLSRRASASDAPLEGRKPRAMLRVRRRTPIACARRVRRSPPGTLLARDARGGGRRRGPTPSRARYNRRTPRRGLPAARFAVRRPRSLRDAPAGPFPRRGDARG